MLISVNILKNIAENKKKYPSLLSMKEIKNNKSKKTQ